MVNKAKVTVAVQTSEVSSQVFEELESAGEYMNQVDPCLLRSFNVEVIANKEVKACCTGGESVAVYNVIGNTDVPETVYNHAVLSEIFTPSPYSCFPD